MHIGHCFFQIGLGESCFGLAGCRSGLAIIIVRDPQPLAKEFHLRQCTKQYLPTQQKPHLLEKKETRRELSQASPSTARWTLRLSSPCSAPRGPGAVAPSPAARARPPRRRPAARRRSGARRRPRRSWIEASRRFNCTLGKGGFSMVFRMCSGCLQDHFEVRSVGVFQTACERFVLAFGMFMEGVFSSCFRSKER